MLRTIDLRSDTVTRPTPAMRRAMAEAEVGDDVYGEDPSVNRLQERTATLLGKEAGLYFPSGTMANQACLKVLTHPGDVVIGSADCHILRYEGGAPAALSGVQIKTIGHGGLFDATEVREAIHPDDAHFAPTTLLAIENTHNVGGGRVFPQELLRAATAAAVEAGLALHLDGARLFNAHVASGVSLVELAEPFDTVSVCLSKGLGAPIGSVVCASAHVISRLHRVRKMLGGGMRQAGIVAAAGLFALEHHVERLADDHDNARLLASGLKRLGFGVEEAPETNIVAFDVPDVRRFLEHTRKRGLLINPVSSSRFRAVTHLDVTRSDVEEALERIAEADLVG
jgi:threonine aldolase